MDGKEIKKAVREGYARIAEQGSNCCGPAGSCCGNIATAQEISRNIGYSNDVPLPRGNHLLEAS